jgi:hypothetical protein
MSPPHRLLTAVGDLERILFSSEQTGNVIENKGSPLKTAEESGNVYENKVT